MKSENPIESDFQSQDSKKFEAEGNVRIDLNGKQLRADKFIYNKINGELTLIGNILFNKGDQYFEATNIYYNLKDEIGYIENIYGQTGIPHTETISIGSSLSGDINYDSILNVLDIVMLVNFVLDSSNPTSSEFNAADMNGDNILNILDIVSLVNTILNS